eukprot:175037_1
MNDAIRKSIRYPTWCKNKDISCKYGNECHWLHNSDINDNTNMDAIESECAKRKDNWLKNRGRSRGRGNHQQYQMNRNNGNNNDNNDNDSAQNVSEILDYVDGHYDDDSPNNESYMMRRISPNSSSHPKANNQSKSHREQDESRKRNNDNNKRIFKYDNDNNIYNTKLVINIHNEGRRLEVITAFTGTDDPREHCRIGCLAGDLWTEALRGSADNHGMHSPGDNNAVNPVPNQSKQLKSWIHFGRRNGII